VELDDAAWVLLHELRLRGTLVEADETAARLLVTHGFAIRKRTVLAITAEGRAEHATWARCSPGSDTEATLRRAYDRFLPLNVELLQVCNDWQVRHSGVANDHTDLEYDWAVIDRLRAIHERTSPIVRAAATALERFAHHRARLRVALGRVDAGDTEWFTSPRIDSYHTVWMQLHEDLLLALGYDRASED